MNLLKKVMILNALSCVGFGFVFLFFSAAVNNFIGNTLSWLTPVLGVVLIVNGGIYIWLVGGKPPSVLKFYISLWVTLSGCWRALY